MGIWYDGDYSLVWDWVIANYEKNADFDVPNGWVFGAQVVFQREILPSEAQYICFGKFPEASSQSFWNEGNCAGTFGLTYATYTVDLFDLPNVDGVFLLRPIQ